MGRGPESEQRNSLEVSPACGAGQALGATVLLGTEGVSRCLQPFPWGLFPLRLEVLGYVASLGSDLGAFDPVTFKVSFSAFPP